MPYCPECKYEYESGTKICPDCGAPLVEGSLPEEEVNPDDDVDAVLLLETENTLRAEFLVGALEQEGIPYVARGLGLTDSLGGAVGGDVSHGAFSSPRPASVRVNPRDYDRAKALLDSLEGEELEEGESTDEGEGI